MAKKIAIIGGGIGGLTTALTLHHFGISCEVFEKDPEFSEKGFGLQISPNALHVFKAINLYSELQSKGFEPDSVLLRDPYTGKVLFQTDNSEKHFSIKTLHIHRGTLHDVLRTAIRKANIPLHFNSPITSYKTKKSHISIMNNDKEVSTADILIGADGIQSNIRTSILGDSPAVFNQKASWRGVVSTKDLPKDLISTDTNVWMGKNQHFVAYYLDKGDLINFVASKTMPRTEENWRIKGDMKELRESFADWDPCIRSLLETCQECFLWGLFDRKPFSTWYKGNVVLLGDAAHPMLPFMAQGASQAIEDAYMIAKQLHKHTDITYAFSEYEALRKTRTSMIQKLSQNNGQLYQANGLLKYARNFIFFLSRHFSISERLQSKVKYIYNYDVTK